MFLFFVFQKCHDAGKIEWKYPVFSSINWKQRVIISFFFYFYILCSKYNCFFKYFMMQAKKNGIIKKCCPINWKQSVFVCFCTLNLPQLKVWRYIDTYLIRNLVWGVMWSEGNWQKIWKFKIIGNLNIFPFITQSDIVSIKFVTLILENIAQCDVTLWNLIQCPFLRSQQILSLVSQLVLSDSLWYYL